MLEPKKSVRNPAPLGTSFCSELRKHLYLKMTPLQVRDTRVKKLRSLRFTKDLPRIYQVTVCKCVDLHEKNTNLVGAVTSTSQVFHGGIVLNAWLFCLVILVLGPEASRLKQTAKRTLLCCSFFAFCKPASCQKSWHAASTAHTRRICMVLCCVKLRLEWHSMAENGFFRRCDLHSWKQPSWVRLGLGLL